MTPGNPWLAIIGLGEDGPAGLNPKARDLLDDAEILVGGRRHFDLLDAEASAPDRRPRLVWQDGLAETMEAIAAAEGRRVCVLASGDPLNHGIGRRLVELFGAFACEIVPQAGAFSLLAARMGWALDDPMVTCVSCHALPLETLHRYLTPNAKLLILARDGETPARIADLLAARGFGHSLVTVIEHMGGAEEGRFDTAASEWDGYRVRDLNSVAVYCRAAPGAQVWPLVPGLPEEAFIHDGKITKREVRAATLARLAPLAGETLWDVGAGSGAVAVEWLRHCPGGQAVAVEEDAKRWPEIEANAANLGVPHLKLVKGSAPDVLTGIEGTPDAIFLGGGIVHPGLLDACWGQLKPRGRLVANAVTLEAQEKLLLFRNEMGGEMTKLAVSRSDPVGRMTALRPLMDVLQLVAVKP